MSYKTSRNNILRLRECGVNVTSSQTINPTTCDSYISPSNQTYTQSGTYNEVLRNIYGCDSVYLTINLSVLSSQPVYSSFSTEICTGESYTWNNVQYMNSGQFQQIFSVNQCRDSIVTLNLIVLNTSDTIISASICQGTAYSWNSQQFTQAGQYIDTLINQYGCDSIVTLNLTVLNTTSSSVTVNACDLVVVQNGNQRSRCC
jgi:hypothetical protein